MGISIQNSASCEVSSDAYQHTGTINSATALAQWLATGKYETPNDMLGDFIYVTAHLKLPNGNIVDIAPSDWLVKENGVFKVYANHVFKSSFVSLGDIKAKYEADLNGDTAPVTQDDVVPIQFEDVTANDIVDVVAKVHFHHFPGTTQVVCLAILKNGYYVVGGHSSLDHDNFDVDKSRQAAFADAGQQIRKLVAYSKRFGKPIV